MAEYLITLKGCDDTTRVVMDLDVDEAELVRRIAAATVVSSEFDCQPRLAITETVLCNSLAAREDVTR